MGDNQVFTVVFFLYINIMSYKEFQQTHALFNDFYNKNEKQR